VKAVEEQRVHVPVYNAPGGLNYRSYESLNTGVKLIEEEVPASPVPVVTSSGPPPDEEREVEGQSARSEADVRELKEQVELLEHDLGVQIKVGRTWCRCTMRY
jgi:hypothetical protein